MKEAYYLTVRLRRGRINIVHKKKCPFLHGISEKIFLGMLDSPLEAIRVGSKYFRSAEKCLFCLGKDNPQHNNDMSEEIRVGCNLLSADQVEPALESALFCAKN